MYRDRCILQTRLPRKKREQVRNYHNAARTNPSFLETTESLKV